MNVPSTFPEFFLKIRLEISRAVGHNAFHYFQRMARNIHETAENPAGAGPREVNGKTEPPKPSPEEELTQTISVRPPAPNAPKPGIEIAKRTALLAAISAGVAALIKKTIQPVLIRLQPQDFPLRVPDEVGFFTGGVLGATGLLLMQKRYKNKPMSRRDFFPVIGAGIGAVIGHMAAKNPQLEQRDAQTQPSGTESTHPQREEGVIPSPEQEVPAALTAEPDESGKL